MNVAAEIRRGERKSITSPFIEEHCLMRVGSQLSSTGRSGLSGANRSLRLLDSRRELIAEVREEGGKILVRDGEGRILSSSIRVGDRVIHYADAEHSKSFGKTEVDTKKNLLTHFMRDTADQFIEIGVEAILKAEDVSDMPPELELSAEMLKGLEQNYPATLFADGLRNADEPLMVEPRPARSKRFTADLGLVKKGDLQFEVMGFGINAAYEATTTLKVRNVGGTSHRLGINAVGEPGFNVPPYVYAKLTDSSGFRFYCSNASGVFWKAKLINMDDAQHLMREQAAGYEPALVKRWCASMDKLEPGSEQFISLKHVLPSEVTTAPDLDLNFTLSMKFYTAPDFGSSFGQIEAFSVDLLGIVPLR